MRLMAKSIFVHRKRGVWAALQRHRATLLRSNEQLALRRAKVADMTSWCTGLKEESAADHASVRRLADEVHRMKVEADLCEEEMRQMKVNL